MRKATSNQSPGQERGKVKGKGTGRHHSSNVPLPNPYEPSLAGRVDSDLTNLEPTYAPSQEVREVAQTSYASAAAYIPTPYPPKQIAVEKSNIDASTDPATIFVSFASLKTAANGRNLGFSGVEFGALNALTFRQSLSIEASQSDGLIMVSVRPTPPTQRPLTTKYSIIEGWQAWFLDSFREALPDFPLESLLYFGAEGGPAMLPLVDNEERGKPN
jgi:hypothetical protein